jgi:hypothetical protein
VETKDRRRLIAIVGNVIAQPFQADRDRAKQAAGALGRELAIAGHRIAVYSSDPCFLEPHVVSGYISSQSAQPSSIYAKYPREKGKIDFPERATHASVFVLQPDSNADWEASFYESLSEVDGALLMGGGRSTLIAGLVAMGRGTAVLAIPSFGGYAQKVWNALSGGSRMTEDEKAILAGPGWNDNTPKAVIGLFETYWNREKERERMRRLETAKISAETKRNTLMAVLLFLVAATCILLTALYPDLPLEYLAAMLVAGAPSAGISGATIRTLADLGQNRLPRVARPTYLTVALGTVAGILSVLLIALPQLLAASRAPEAKAVILAGVIPAALLTAFFAGFALDQFYRKLRNVELKDVEIPQP